MTDFLGKQNRDGIRNKCAADGALCFVICAKEIATEKKGKFPAKSRSFKDLLDNNRLRTSSSLGLIITDH